MTGSAYRLERNELLQYPGLHGSLALCHLRVYEAAGATPVVIVGHFDDLTVGTSTTNAIELLATFIAERLDTDEFMLIEFYPNSWLGRTEFTEARLQRVEGHAKHHGVLVICGAGATRDRVRVGFVRPDFRSVPEEELEQLLGAQAVSELHELGSFEGRYTVQRVFGADGARRLAEVAAYNRRPGRRPQPRLREWELLWELD